MGQFSKVLQPLIMHTVPQRDLDCEPGLDGLNHVYGPKRPTSTVQSICGKYINIFTKCTILNQHDILMTWELELGLGTGVQYGNWSQVLALGYCMGAIVRSRHWNTVQETGVRSGQQGTAWELVLGLGTGVQYGNWSYKVQAMGYSMGTGVRSRHWGTVLELELGRGTGVQHGNWSYKVQALTEIKARTLTLES